MSDSIQQIRTDLNAIDARLRAFENAPTIPFKFGFVSHGDQLDLVKQFGTSRASVSFWPGGARSMESVFAHGIEILPSIKREAQDGKPAMSPLKSQSEIDAEKSRHLDDITIYKKHGVKIVELGNEIDIPRYWSGTVEQFAPDYARHIAPLYRSSGIAIIFGGPQVKADNWQPFIASLANAGQIYPTDRFAIHPYRGDAVAHFDFLTKSVESAQKALPNKINLNRFDITECGLQRGGTHEARRDELEKLLAGYVARGFTGSIYGYRIMETDRHESVMSAFDKFKKETIYAPTWRKFAS